MSAQARLLSFVPRAAAASAAGLCQSPLNATRSFTNSTLSAAAVTARANPVLDDDASEAALRDLFHRYARRHRPSPDGGDGATGPTLGVVELRDLLTSVGERPSMERLGRILCSDVSLDLTDFLDRCGSILEYDAAGLEIGEDGDNGDDGASPSLERIFRALDLNSNGVISRSELTGLLSTTGGRIDGREARDVMRRISSDAGGGGREVTRKSAFNVHEFAAFVRDPDVARFSWRLRSAFRAAFVIGGPASGKTTLCDRLQAEADMKRCDVGVLIRREAASGSELGKEIDDSMRKGWLIPSSDVMALLRKELSHRSGSFVAFDGFPRTKRNYRDFEKAYGHPEFAVYVSTPEEVMIERMLSGYEERGRPICDDTVKNAKHRIQAFQGLAKPMMKQLQKDGIPVHKLDGEQSPSGVWRQLLDLNLALRRKTETLLQAPSELAEVGQAAQ